MASSLVQAHDRIRERTPPPPPPPPPAPPPPPPPPPLPSDISMYASVKGTKPLIAGESWPHRLLHVDSMTSHVRSGHNTYNGSKAPDYNIVSYTWGYFKDATHTEKALMVNGVDWPIPPIKKSHFSAETFKAALSRVAQGVEHPCEWVWVDIACIPQEHPDESGEARALRDQEIGRQVEIFYRAKESFAWLSSLKVSHLCEDERVVDIEDYMRAFNQSIAVRSGEDAARWLLSIDQKAIAMQQWMDKILCHPWLLSLWTLQEMVLRPDSFFLFDDGLLKLYQDNDEALATGSPWTLGAVKQDIYSCLVWHNGADNKRVLQRIASLASQLPASSHLRPKDIVDLPERTLQRMQALVDTQRLKGLDALNVEYPHTAYSIASSRRVTKIQDRIYGIVQTYGIVCSARPLGDDDVAQLHALEDEFGRHLVSKSPMLSQVFIHGAEDEWPRRSWLITQKCKVDDGFWTIFVSSISETLFKDLSVVKSPDDSNLALHFAGKAWMLSSFIEASSPSNGSTIDPNLLFKPRRADEPREYRGLMLDRHVCKRVLGHVVDYFDSYENMMEATEKLYQYYRQRKYDHRIHHEFNDECEEGDLRVALLGSGGFKNAIVLYYVGLVLAPARSFGSLKREYNPCEVPHTQPSRIFEWERIGLMRWEERYYGGGNRRYKRFNDLPAYHNFQCRIV